MIYGRNVTKDPKKHTVATWNDLFNVCVRRGYNPTRIHGGVEIDGVKYTRKKGRVNLFLKLVEEA